MALQHGHIHFNLFSNSKLRINPIILFCLNCILIRSELWVELMRRCGKLDKPDEADAMFLKAEKSLNIESSSTSSQTSLSQFNSSQDRVMPATKLNDVSGSNNQSKAQLQTGYHYCRALYYR
jgi:hypothetical protein